MLIALMMLQAMGGEPAPVEDSHRYLSRCLAAGQTMVVVMDRLEAERSVDMSGMQARTAGFNRGIERLRLTAVEREGLTEAQVAADRREAEAVAGLPVRDVLVVMDGCEAAHEVMD